MQAQEPRTPWMHAVEEAGHVQKARAGDRRALATLLRHYHLPLYRLAFARTRDVRAAVGIARTAVLRARDGVRYMPEDTRFFPWAAHIVRKLAHSQPAAGASASGSVGPAQRAEADVVELAARLLRTLDDLDSNQQMALALRVVELLPDALIETTLRVALGTSPVLLAAARSRLTAQLAGRVDQRGDHLTPEHLSANLEGALAGFRLEQVRMHLDLCDRCRLLGVRMASTNDVMTALLTHDPGAAFHQALEEFVVDRLDAKDPEPIPPALEREIAAEVERLDAHRWAAVRHALPRPIVAPVAGAPAEVAAAKEAEKEIAKAKPAKAKVAKAEVAKAKPAEPQATAAKRATPKPAAARPATESAPSQAVPLPAHRITPLPAHPTAAPPAPKRAPRSVPVAARAPAGATPQRARPDVASWVFGATGAVLIVVIAGLYLARAREARTQSGAAHAPAAAVSAPAEEPIHAMRSPSPEEGSASASIPPQPAATVADPPATQAPPAATVAPEAHAAIVPKSIHAASRPETVAVAPPARSSQPAKASRPTASHAPAAATPRGILCGQVRDDAGAPVVGAQVLLADLHVGALTDRHGRFCISVPFGSRTVSVIALGFATERRVVEVGRTTPELGVALRSAAVEQSRRGEDP